jgi:type VI secretion system secreted protein VgrG
MTYTQEGRLLSLNTPLGKDILLLQGVNGRESISRPFVFHLDLLSENPSIAYDRIVGQRVGITIEAPDESQRNWNGFVSRFVQAGSDYRFTHYRAEIVPWLWFLTRTADCRIFQNMTVPDIIVKIFRDLGFNDFRNALQGSFEPREYCVQYRETDFNFVSRLMEQYGIFYFFEHEADRHTLVIANDSSAYKTCARNETVRVNYAPGGLVDEDVITAWNVEQELRTGKCSLTDYNFETPSSSLLVTEPSIIHVDGNSKYEIYDYPGTYLKKAQGENLAKVRMQEEESISKVASGSGGCYGFAAGYKFNLDGYYRTDMNEAYLLTEVQHIATVGGSYVSGEASGENYSNHFKCIPAKVPYRPDRMTPKPFVQGPQTAVVVGKAGEEIWVDKYGRVKVQFHWDREGKKDENSSCWVRVAQAWAGKNWGAMWIPRIGQEVIVDFLEGDPDQPIITGRVYNAEEMPPYTLPDNQTRSTFKSRSTKGGGSANYNEIRFEDKMGSEQIFVNAEKDMDLRVENDSREFVGNDRSLIVKGNQKEKVEGDLHSETIGNRNEKVGQTMSLQVGQALNEKTGMKFAHEAGQEIHLKAGMNVVIEAGTELTIKASGGFINIGPAGVAIQGTMVLINSGGAAGSGSGCSPQDPQKPDEADDGTKGGKK